MQFAGHSFFMFLITKTDSDTFCFLNHLAVRINGFQFAGNLCQWHTFCLSIDHCDHAAVIFLNDCLCCCRAKSGTEHSVIWTWASAPLCMSRNRNTDLNACCFINLIRNLIGNGRIFLCSGFQFLFVFLFRKFCVFFGNRTDICGRPLLPCMLSLSGMNPPWKSHLPQLQEL